MKLPNTISEFIQSEELIWDTNLDLDLFAIKLLMTRYNGNLMWVRDEENTDNICILIFNSESD